MWASYNGPKESYGRSQRMERDRGLRRGGLRHAWSTGGEAGFWPTGWLLAVAYASYAHSIDYANAQDGDALTISPYVACKIGGTSRRTSATSTSAWTSRTEGSTPPTSRISRPSISSRPRCSCARSCSTSWTAIRPCELYPYAVSPEEQSLTSQGPVPYKLNPQTVLFLGYGDSHYGDQTVDLTQTERTFFAKIGYAWTL